MFNLYNLCINKQTVDVSHEMGGNCDFQGWDSMKTHCKPVWRCRSRWCNGRERHVIFSLFPPMKLKKKKLTQVSIYKGMLILLRPDRNNYFPILLRYITIGLERLVMSRSTLQHLWFTEWSNRPKEISTKRDLSNCTRIVFQVSRLLRQVICRNMSKVLILPMV